jgi:RNA polymerase sigma-70 factor (ECF subfamily)
MTITPAAIISARRTDGRSLFSVFCIGTVAGRGCARLDGSPRPEGASSTQWPVGRTASEGWGRLAFRVARSLCPERETFPQLPGVLQEWRQRVTESAPDDVEAVRRLQEGDETALQLLYDRYLDRVFRFSVRLLGRPEEAEEVTAEAFLQAFRYARDYRGDGSFAGWLFRIAHNLCVSRLRRARRLQVISLDELAEGGWDSAQGVIGDEPVLRLAVQEALQQLPPDYRAVLVMRDVDGLTNAEAAEALGRSRAATKSLHFRARQALRDALAGALGMEDK